MALFGNDDGPRAEWVSFGAGGPETEVHVPLLRGEGDPAVRVPAYVGDQVRTLAWLDLSPGAPIRIGLMLRIRSGLPEPRRGRVRIPVIRIGDVVLRDVEAEEVPGEDLVLGLDGLPGIGVWVRPSVGDLVWMPVEEARGRLASVGPVVPWSLPPGPAELLWTDLLIDPSARAMASRLARHPQWTDADVWLGDLLQDDALLGGEVTGPDFLATVRWGRVSPRWFAIGDLEALHTSDSRLARAAAGDCEVLSGVAERAVRVQDAELLAVVTEVATLWAAWRTSAPADRERLRAAGEGIDDTCAAIGRFSGGAPWDALDPWPTARLAWTEHLPAAARFATNLGVELPAHRAVLLDGLLDAGTDDAVRNAVLALQDDAAPHPLTRAVLVADRVGITPRTVAERVAADLPVDPDELALLALTRPGDAATDCLVAAAEPVRVIPDLPEADCLAAALVRARRTGDREGEATARAELGRRWPDVWVDDPDPSGVRTLRRPLEDR